VRRLVSDHVVPMAARLGVRVVDGATNAGVMALLGEARMERGMRFDLVGVVVDGLAAWPGRAGFLPDGADLDPGHSHFVLVPGEEWGAESPWLARVTATLAAEHPSCTVLIGGGPVSLSDVELSVADERPVVVVSGTGRLADEIATATAGGDCEDRRVATVAASPLVSVVAVTDADERIEMILSGGAAHGG
jgi:hypothetical protein